MVWDWLKAESLALDPADVEEDLDELDEGEAEDFDDGELVDWLWW